MPDQPDDRHRRPEGADDATVAAAGKVSEAMEWVVRARGRLYDVHQMIGHADEQFGEAVRMLEDAGHAELAEGLRGDLVGRNVLRDRWTFEVVEDFDATYYEAADRWDRRVRDELMDGRRHVHEAEMKADRRTDGPRTDR